VTRPRGVQDALLVTECRGARYLTTREAAKLAIVGAAKVSTAGAAKLTILKT
jgi:hypothetical protein